MSKNNLIVVANWKAYNASLDESVNFISLLKKHILDHHNEKEVVNVVICPSFPFIERIQSALENTPIKLGGQNCCSQAEGAFTGEVTAKMLKNIKCEYVIVGHSERRLLFNEDSKEVQEKILEIQKNKMSSIVCIGETLKQREDNLTKEVIYKQIINSIPKNAIPENTIIAYEPIWAIGNDKTASINDITEISEFIHEVILENFKQFSNQGIKIIYGGSVSDKNSKDIINIPKIVGFLVGRSSLVINSFIEITNSVKYKHNFV